MNQATNDTINNAQSKPLCRAIIVDDEEPGRIMLRYALKDYANWQIAGEFSNVASAGDFLAQNTVDVVFLDIQMPKENGIALARSLASMEQPPLIIFVTAYNAHAVEAFEVHALDYLLKPFNASRFAQALEHADEILTQRRGYGKALQTYVDAEDRAKQDPANYIQNVVVRSVGEMECVRIDQINWLASASNYVELHLDNRVVLHRITLSKLEQMLDPKQFQRIHRTTIVRRNQLQQISVVGDGVYQLKLFCGATVPVSEKYIDDVRAAFEA